MPKRYFNLQYFILFVVLGFFTSIFTIALSYFFQGEYLEQFVIVFIASFLVSSFLAFLFGVPYKKDTQKLNSQLDLEKEKLAETMKLVDKYVIRTTTDPAGVITSVNKAFCDVSGYSKEELIGKSHSIIRHPDMPKKFFKKMWKKLYEGEEWTGEIKNRRKDGTHYWVKTYIKPLYNDKHDLMGYSAIRLDITDKIDLELENDKNNAIIKFASSGIGTIDLKGNFLSANDAYSKILGYDKEQMIGMNCVDISYDEMGRKISKKALAVAKDIGSIYKFEKICRHANGEKVYVEVSLDLLPNKNEFVIVVNSLEDQKRLEYSNLVLEKRVNEQVEKNIKQMELMQEEKLKSVKLSSIGALAAGITHEINTPLTYIKGNLELMQFDIEDLPDSNIKNNLKEDNLKLLEGVNRIANIVEAMREVSQISNETKTVENVYDTLITSLTISHNASKVISKIYLNDEEFMLENVEKGKVSSLTYIQKQRVEQVWLIIVNNALDELVKCEDYESRWLKINIVEDGEFVKVLFKDNAGGIREDLLDNIFDPFVSTKESGGIGVGLNIAKKIIEDQDGEIYAYNEDGGAVFEVVLPFAKA